MMGHQHISDIAGTSLGCCLNRLVEWILAGAAPARRKGQWKHVETHCNNC